MKRLFVIVSGEWQYWLRSHLALGSILIFLVLIVTTSLLTVLQIQAKNHARALQQTEAEDTFLAQPNRHPHRMVHYGHYVFRTPAPLAIFDPGLESVTGESIFLEGHRQNTAMFSESGASANFGGLSWLTPALIYQFFAPLVILLLGHGSIVREREACVLTPLLAQGIDGRTLILGKALALVSFATLLLLPLAVSCAIAFVNGGALSALISLLGVYFIYLTVWSLLALCFSALLNKRSTVLATLTALWFCFTLVLPSVAVNIAAYTAPLPGKIETDLKMLADLRKLGDGHNANDPAFAQLRANLFIKYGVERVEDLPINFRGLVAIDAEGKLTKVLNDYAESRMAGETKQEKLLTSYAWLTPTLALASASRALAGTDLEHYHRFQREAEALRFEFVQGLNRAHVQKLSYQDDINRNKSEASSLRARVDASNWQVLNKFKFQPATTSKRMTYASSSITILMAWLAVTLCVLILCAKRIKP